MNNFGAFLLAPFPAAVLGAAISFFTGGFPRPVSVLLFYLLIFYAAQLLFGIAIRLWLRRRSSTAAGSFALGGLLMIALPAIPYLGWAATLKGQYASAIYFMALLLACGALIGLTYWWLTRPDVAKPGP